MSGLMGSAYLRLGELCHSESSDEKAPRNNRVVDEIANCLRAGE